MGQGFRHVALWFTIFLGMGRVSSFVGKLNNIWGISPRSNLFISKGNGNVGIGRWICFLVGRQFLHENFSIGRGI